MAPHETRSYYLPEDVEETIAARTPRGWSKSAVLTRIVRRYVSLTDRNTPQFSEQEWIALREAEFGFADKHGYGLDSVRRLSPELREKVDRLSELERMAIWDHLVERAKAKKSKKGGGQR